MCSPRLLFGSAGLRRRGQHGIPSRTMTMNRCAFNTAAAAFALSHPEWVVAHVTDAQGHLHSILHTSRSVRARTAPVIVRDNTESSGPSWCDDEEDTSRAPQASPVVCCPLQLQLSVRWSAAFLIPTVYFTATDAGVPVVDAVALAHSYLRWTGREINVYGEASGMLISLSIDEAIGTVAFLLHPCDIHDMITPYAAALRVRGVSEAALHVAMLDYVIANAFDQLLLVK